MNQDREIVLIAHNLRSCHNVGSLLRTAEGLGISEVFLTGYTPYPKQVKDDRLPYLAAKTDKQIHKTALGAEQSVKWQHKDDILSLISELAKAGYEVCALEQARDSIKLPDYKAPAKVALIIGREVEGVESEVLAKVHKILEIPMFGQKESFNVTQAAAMALYHIKFGE